MPCLLREELLGQPPVFGGDAQTPAVALAELGGDVVEVGHGVDVEPDFRHGDHHIGGAEAEPRPDRGLLLPVGDVLAQQILAGDAEIDAALADLACNLGGRQEGDLDVVASLDAGAVFSVVAGQADGEPGLRQHLQRLVLAAGPSRGWRA